MDPNPAASVADRLREDIRTGRLPPGSILRQDALADRFGVSRQPVRLALEVLRASGLVTPRRDRSVEVVAMSAEALRDLVAVRLLAERQALVLSIRSRTESDVHEARYLQERLEREADPHRVEELDCSFHAALYKPAGNPRLLRLIDDLRREDRRPYREQPLGSDERANWAQHHRKLLDAFAAGDCQAAVTALESHLMALTRR
jgi:DNA-binding GntR family transcriptional regulator